MYDLFYFSEFNRTGWVATTHDPDVYQQWYAVRGVQKVLDSLHNYGQHQFMTEATAFVYLQIDFGAQLSVRYPSIIVKNICHT